MKQMVSPIAFRSNLYPLKQGGAPIRADKDFLSQILARRAVAVLHDEINRGFITKWMYKPSEIQENIYKKIVITPAWCLRYPGTQPWGAVLIDGKERVVCKCDERNCKGYQYCQKSIIHKTDAMVDSNGLRERMKEWYQGWIDLRYKIEEIRDRYDANASLDNNKFEKIEKFIIEAEGKSNTFDSWLQELRNLKGKEDYKAYNAGLLDCEKWLDEISRLKNRIEEKELEIEKYKHIAKNNREFHRNWIIDWEALEEEVKQHLKNLFAERFVSDLADKVDSIKHMSEMVSASREEHQEKREWYQNIEEKCSGLLTWIQELLDTIDANISAVKSLSMQELKSSNEEEILQAGNTSNQQLFALFKQVEQEEFMHLPVEARTIVNAGPGRGKTYSLIKRMEYLVREKNVDPADILVLCFSRAAVAEIQKRIQKECAGDEDLEGVAWQIGTIDSYCWMLTHCNDEQTSGNNIPGLYEEGIRNALTWLNSGDRVVDAKYIIVDEIQDIVGVRGEFILSLLEHMEKDAGFALLGDFCQSIYDFQMKGHPEDELTSSRFFRKLYKIPEVSKFSFSHNYRSDASSSLNQKLDVLRTALINEDADNAASQIKEIENSGILSKDTLDSIVDSVVAEHLEGNDKTTGILAWQNVTVTEIASRFYECMFEKGAFYPVHVQKQKDNAYLAGWIGIFFQNYADNRIDEARFIDSFESIFDDEAKMKLNMQFPASYYWEALEQCMIEDDSYSKGEYAVEKMLRGIKLNAWRFRENCGVLLSGILPNSSIIISTVHQAKGREYDEVYISQSLLDISNDPSNESCRVAYVALSRSKGSVSFFDKTFSKSRQHRIARTGRKYTKKGQNSNFRPAQIEFGYHGDVDEAGFANEEVQQYIQEFLPVGTQLQLNKHFVWQDGQRKIAYELAMDGGEPGVPDVLGKAGSTFMNDLSAAMSDARRGEASAFEDYPKTIENLYVNDLITIIDKDIGQGDGLKKYGNLVIWNGLSLIGTGECAY